MRKLGLFLGVSFLALTHVGVATAQETGRTVDLTGCLAQEEEGDETEFLLENVADSDAHEIELVAAEGVNMSPHVGHTVKISGTVVADDAEEADEADEADDDEAETEEAAEAEGVDEDGDLHVTVTKLTHVAASCGSD